MSARAVRSLQSPLTPLFKFRTRHCFANFTTSEQSNISIMQPNIPIMQPKVSEGQDKSKVFTETNALLEGGWILDDEEMGVKRTFYFKTYTKALVRGVIRAFTAPADALQDFLSLIGVRSKSKNHHSVMTIVRLTLYVQRREPGLCSFQQTGSVYVHWTTHHPRGLSEKDTLMARYCDEQARLIGTVEESEAQKCRSTSSSQM